MFWSFKHILYMLFFAIQTWEQYLYLQSFLNGGTAIIKSISILLNYLQTILYSVVVDREVNCSARPFLISIRVRPPVWDLGRFSRYLLDHVYLLRLVLGKGNDVIMTDSKPMSETYRCYDNLILFLYRKYQTVRRGNTKVRLKLINILSTTLNFNELTLQY